MQFGSQVVPDNTLCFESLVDVICILFPAEVWVTLSEIL